MGDVSGLRGAVAVVERFVAGFDPACWHGSDAAELVGLFNRLERVCAAGRTLAAGRVEETSAWRASGARSARAWLASETGTSLGEAGAVLATASRLGSLPSTETRFRTGELSESQTAAVAGAASVAPGSEAGLLREAERSSVDGLRKRCQSVRASALAHQAVVQRQAVHASRYLKTWTTLDGAYEGRFRLTLDHGAVVAAALDAYHEKVFRAARVAGVRNSFEAMEADALVAVARAALYPAGGPGSGASAVSSARSVCAPKSAVAGPTSAGAPDGGSGTAGLTGGGASGPGARETGETGEGPATGSAPDAGEPGGPNTGAGDPGSGGDPPGLFDPGPPPEPTAGPLAHIVFRVDYPAYQRGYTLPGETCEIENLGPVPVATARRYANDAILTAILHHGEKIIDAVTIGRTIPIRLRAALVERDRTCAVPGCDQHHHLEIHHLQPVAQGGETSLHNTCRICPFHHDQITYNHATLTGPHPNWTYTPGPPPGQPPAEPIVT